MGVNPIAKLTKNESEILSLAQFDGDLSYGEIARKYGFSERSVRHVFNNLAKTGVAKKTVFIDPYKIGLKTLILYFSIRGSTISQRKKLIASMVKTSSVAWLAEIGGDYQYGCAIQSSTYGTIKQALTAISRTHAGIIREKTVLSQHGITLLPRQFLGSYAHNKKFSCTETVDPVFRDGTDLAILSHLSSDGSLSMRAIGSKLSISHTTVENRVNQMIKEGIIVGTYYRVDARKLGCRSFKLLISLRLYDNLMEEKLLKYLSAHPMIVNIIETIGNWDLEIGADAFQPSDVPALVYDLHEKFDAMIASIKVIPVFQGYKFIQIPC